MTSSLFRAINLHTNSAYLNLIISFTSVLIILTLLYIPQINYNYSSYSDFEKSLESVQYQICIGIFVLTPLPLLFDLLLDFLTGFHTIKFKKYWIARVIVGFSTLVFGYLLSHLNWLANVMITISHDPHYVTSTSPGFYSDNNCIDNTFFTILFIDHKYQWQHY